jgi:hypothetical protein
VECNIELEGWGAISVSSFYMLFKLVISGQILLPLNKKAVAKKKKNQVLEVLRMFELFT